jgi:hypothetical protein
MGWESKKNETASVAHPDSYSMGMGASAEMVRRPEREADNFLEHSVHLVHRQINLIIKPTRCTNFPNLFLE